MGKRSENCRAVRTQFPAPRKERKKETGPGLCRVVDESKRIFEREEMIWRRASFSRGFRREKKKKGGTPPLPAALVWVHSSGGGEPDGAARLLYIPAPTEEKRKEGSLVPLVLLGISWMIREGMGVDLLLAHFYCISARGKGKERKRGRGVFGDVAIWNSCMVPRGRR